MSRSRVGFVWESVPTRDLSRQGLALCVYTAKLPQYTASIGAAGYAL